MGTWISLVIRHSNGSSNEVLARTAPDVSGFLLAHVEALFSELLRIFTNYPEPCCLYSYTKPDWILLPVTKNSGAYSTRMPSCTQWCPIKYHIMSWLFYINTLWTRQPCFQGMTVAPSTFTSTRRNTRIIPCQGMLDHNAGAEILEKERANPKTSTWNALLRICLLVPLFSCFLNCLLWQSLWLGSENYLEKTSFC